MRDVSPQSPEARRKRLASMRAAFGTEVEEKLKPRRTPWEVVKRVAIGVYNDGFIHAGNLAYLAILALFPFFILAAAVAHLLGQSEDAQLTVANVLRRLPPDVATTLQGPIREVLSVRTGTLLWLGALVGLWTAASLFFTFCVLFFALTPARYRRKGRRPWPGPLFITAWWLATVEILPNILGLLGGYSLTYGSLAGVMISLIFFFVVGLGVVMGAELNAALAEAGATALKGELYSGPYTDELVVEEPEPGEDVEPEL